MALLRMCRALLRIHVCECVMMCVHIYQAPLQICRSSFAGAHKTLLRIHMCGCVWNFRALLWISRGSLADV